MLVLWNEYNYFDDLLSYSEVNTVQMFSKLEDKRINACNVMLVMTVKEYIDIARDIRKKNVYQRNRVSKSNTVYSLLKKDLLIGCIIPPIILALNITAENSTLINDKITDNALTYDDLLENKSHLLILDGFQRTNIILDIIADLERNSDIDILKEFHDRSLRIELYTGINRLGILYRMLTLNTGQTPMSLRHQIEMMYYDYLDSDIDGVSLLRDTDDEKKIDLNKYLFKDVIDGFNSYLDRNELPIDRMELLDNIKGLEKLSKENSETDLFGMFIMTYNDLVRNIYEATKEDDGTVWEFNSDASEVISGNPYGKNIVKIFNKSQTLTGFGAAVGKLIDSELISGFDEVKSNTSKVKNINDESLIMMLENLDRIRLKSKKIGNAQRMYFQYIFRELLNPDNDSYLDFYKAVSSAYQKYQSQVE